MRNQSRSLRSRLPIPLFSVVILAYVVLTIAVPAQEAVTPVSAAPRMSLTLGEALRASQSTRTSVEYYKPDGSKGLLQLPVLDLARDAKNVQICLLIDGTESMGQDLDGVKNGLTAFIEGINRGQKQIQSIDVSIVVYRDFGSPDGIMTFVTPVDEQGVGDFLPASDPQLLELLQKITTQAGTPRFPEQVDRGLHAVIHKLRWLPGDETSRSIIIAGDAPPFPEEQLEALDPLYKQSMRGFTTSQLATDAQQAGITVFGVLCNSGFKGAKSDPAVARIADLCRGEMRQFLQTLANETGGRLLDLSDPNIIDLLLNRSDKQVELPRISHDDLEKRKQQQLIRLAVLPPDPLAKITENRVIWPSTPGRAFAYALVSKVQSVDSRCVIAMKPLFDDLALICERATEAEKSNPSTLLQRLAAADNLDFVLWGDYAGGDGDQQTVVLRLYDRLGRELARSDRVSGAGLEDLLQPATQSLVGKLKGAPTSPQPESATASPRIAQTESIKALRKVLETPAAIVDESLKDETLAKAYALLEEATEHELGASAGIKACETAKELLQNHPAIAAQSPFALFLLSNCERNLGNTKQADEFLTAAHQSQAQIPDGLKQEIAADYMLLLEKNPAGAAAQYLKLLEQAEADDCVYGKQALRVKWTLAGLYLGAWGFEQTREFREDEVGSMNRAREMILDVLVYWPESPESQRYISAQFVQPPPVNTPRRKPSPVQNIGFNPGVPAVGATLRAPRGGRVAALIKGSTTPPGS